MPAAKRSTISYCDYSGGDLNFVLGCTPVSAGCANCYARCIYERFGKDFSVVRTYPSKLGRLERWLLAKQLPSYRRGPGSRPLAFVCDMSDLFHKDVSEDFILQAFWAMQYRDDIDWLVLTKRANRMQRSLRRWNSGNQGPYHPAPNIWVGVTVENQDNLWRIRCLVNTPAATRWVSLEPLLEPVDIRPWLPGLNWIVVGAESGPNRRPFRRWWPQDILQQCRAADVPCFLKQDSGLYPGALLLDEEYQEVKEWPKT